jgi:hypothetical protein
VSVSRIVLPDAGEGGGCSADAWGRGGPRAICGLVRKDAARKRRTAGHLWPCAERCLGRSGGPRAICGQRTVGSASDSR